MEEKNTVELGDRPGLDLDSVEELEESLNATEEKKLIRENCKKRL